MKKSVMINGQRFRISHMRNSKKGAEVVGGRFHVKGLGTVYIQVYEKAPEDQIKRHIEDREARPRAEVRTPERKVDQIDEMLIETLRVMSKRMEKLEQRAVILPEGSMIPNPRPTHDGHGQHED